MLEKAHKSKFAIHSIDTKMYRVLRLSYWCSCMNRERAWYVDRCLTCHMVKVEDQSPHQKLQAMEIPMCKWEHITLDFFTKLPWTTMGFDTIWVIMDCLTKSGNFVAIRESSSTRKLADLYMCEIVSQHGIPVSIVSDRDVRVIYHFWHKFHEELGTWLHLSIAYHP